MSCQYLTLQCQQKQLNQLPPRIVGSDLSDLCEFTLRFFKKTAHDC